MTDLIRTTPSDGGILVAVIDMPGRTMNVFSVDLMDALDALMDRVDRDDTVTGVVITSGKSSFLAGADLSMVRSFTDRAKTATHDEMFQLCGRLGRQFVRLEASPKPYVAAVNGIALGGGLELALACRERLVADDPRIQLGTPEVRWGLLPGAGGTQRLPRLADLKAAFDILLTGRSITPKTAVSLGIFARALPAAELLDAAKTLARSLVGTPYDPARKFPRTPLLDVAPFTPELGPEIAARFGIGAEAFQNYPAHSAIIDSVLKGARLPLAEATDVEMREFLRLMFDPVAGRMVRTLFLERLRAERELTPADAVRIERIAVGPFTDARASWHDALAKTRLPTVADASVPADTIDLFDAGDRRVRVHLRLTSDMRADCEFDADGHAALAVLSPSGPYGRVVEILAGDGDAALIARLALMLRALPWRTFGIAALLPQLHDQSLPRQARRALLALASVEAGDPAFLDVAACLAGVSPPWSGGPLAWLVDEHESVVPHFDAEATAAWTLNASRLREACA